MAREADCLYCGEPLTDAHLYVRGLGASLFWSTRPDVPLISRRDLTQIDLERISSGGTGMQAIVPALRCDACGAIVFRGA